MSHWARLPREEVMSTYTNGHVPDYRVAVIDELNHAAKAVEKYGLPVTATYTLEEAGTRLSELGRYQIIIVGVSLFPIRRRIVNELRRVAPDACLVFLRRAHEFSNGQSPLEVKNTVSADFMLSASSPDEVWLAAQSLKHMFPLPTTADLEPPAEAFLMDRVMKVVAAHYQDPNLNLRAVASRLNLSSGQLSRLLNRHAGMRFRQLLQQTRLEAAKQLLMTANCTTIKEVAFKVGFADSDYFSRAFKRYTGCCATEYRENSALQ
jgi:AraC-like DNA-binding protein